MSVPVPANEAQRLEAVRRYSVLKALTDAELNDLAGLAATLCNAPAAAVSIVDANRQWFRGRFGIAVEHTPREVAFCAHAIVDPSQPFVVADATRDPRFAANPLVTDDPRIRFYAGLPLTTPDGLALGTLCVLDFVPRTLEDHHLSALASLRRGVMALLEVRRTSVALASTLQARDAAVAALAEGTRRLDIEVEKRTAHLTSVMDRISDGFTALDREWRYVYVNERGAALLGRKPQELIGQHIWTLFPEGVGQPFHLAYEEAVRTQRPTQMNDYYPPWNRWFENRIYPSADGLTIFFSDTTEARQAHEVMRLSELRLRLATEASHTGLWDWDLRTNDVYFSEEWKRQIGYSDSELPNHFDEFSSRVHPDDVEPLMNAVRSYIANPDGVYEVEFRFRHRDGHYLWILTRAAVIKNAEGRPIRMLGSHLDVTARKAQQLDVERSRAELSRLSQQVLRTREEEAARISREIHDLLGQTLTTLRMDVGWLERRCPGTDIEGHQRLRDMGTSLTQAVGEVRRIASDLRPAILDDLGLEAALEWLCREFRLRGEMSLRADVRLTEEPSPEVGAAVFRIVQEGLTNAAKHAPSSQVYLRLSTHADEWQVTLSDNGTGAGTALTDERSSGLRGIRERAELLGGQASYESGQGDGFTLTVRIPRRLAL